MSEPANSLRFALVHSPLTGPEVWWPVAARLRDLGHVAIVPDLHDDPSDPRPLWQQHVRSAVDAITMDPPADEDGRMPTVLVAHSGAGPLLGHIGAALLNRPAGYLYVDAGLPPKTRQSRLDLIRVEGGEWVGSFEAFLHAGGAFPNWTEADLADTLPDPADRQMVIATLRRRGLAYFSELLEASGPVRVMPGAYLQWTPSYDIYAERVAAFGWPLQRSPAGHFHMLVDPQTVAADLVALARQ